MPGESFQAEGQGRRRQMESSSLPESSTKELREREVRWLESQGRVPDKGEQHKEGELRRNREGVKEENCQPGIPEKQTNKQKPQTQKS